MFLSEPGSYDSFIRLFGGPARPQESYWQNDESTEYCSICDYFFHKALLELLHSFFAYQILVGMNIPEAMSRASGLMMPLIPRSLSDQPRANRAEIGRLS